MLYTALTIKALKISYDAHKDALDKGGAPYVFHPFYLATQMESEAEICVALLHDVIEDSDKYSFNDLINEGFTDEIIEALRLLTHDDDIEYMDYIKKIKANNIATRVKLADLHHNIDITRTNNKKPPKYVRYLEAINYLSK